MSAGPPTRLTDRAFLVAYDVERKKLTGSNRDQLVGAAALVELTLAGRLVDRNGKPQVTGGRTGDPVLDAVLARISQSRPRSWKYWVAKVSKGTYLAVRERLAEERVIVVTRGTVLGIFRRDVVQVRNTRLVRELVSTTRRVVLSGTPADRLAPLDVALVPLVAAVELNTVFSGRERREHRTAIAALAEAGGPAAKALRKVVEAQHAAGGAA